MDGENQPFYNCKHCKYAVYFFFFLFLQCLSPVIWRRRLSFSNIDYAISMLSLILTDFFPLSVCWPLNHGLLSHVHQDCFCWTIIWTASVFTSLASQLFLLYSNTFTYYKACNWIHWYIPITDFHGKRRYVMRCIVSIFGLMSCQI